MPGVEELPGIHLLKPNPWGSNGREFSEFVSEESHAWWRPRRAHGGLPSGRSAGLVGRNRENQETGPHLLGEIAPGNSLCAATLLADLPRRDREGAVPRAELKAVALKAGGRDGPERGQELLLLLHDLLLRPVLALRDQRFGFGLSFRAHRSASSSALGGLGWQCSQKGLRRHAAEGRFSAAKTGSEKNSRRGMSISERLRRRRDGGGDIPAERRRRKCDSW